MVALTVPEQQILDLISTLPTDRRRLLLYELAKDSEAAWQRNTAYAEGELRKVAAAKGMNWDEMDDELRQDFVSELLHEGK